MADDGVDDLVGAAGVGEKLGEHRAERDENSHAGRGGAETLAERLQHRSGFSPATLPTARLPKISARNGCSLTTVINTTISAIPASAARISCHHTATGCG